MSSTSLRMNRGSTATTKNRALPFLKNQLHLLHFSATMEKTQEVFYYGQAYHSLAAQGRAFCRRKGRDQGKHQNRTGGLTPKRWVRLKKMRGRGAMCRGRSRIERHGGHCTRENAGMSSERHARNMPVESPRFPGEGSSAQGKSGPKPRTEVVGDGQQV